MKIRPVYCPHCDERFEWFDPEVMPNEVGALVGSLVGGMATPTLASGLGIVLISGWPGTLLGLALGGLMGNVVGRSIQPNGVPCPRCGPGEPIQEHCPAVSQTDAEPQPEVHHCQISEIISEIKGATP